MGGNSRSHHSLEPSRDGELTQIQGFSGVLFDSCPDDLPVDLTAGSVPVADTAGFLGLPPVPILPELPALPIPR